MNALPQDYNDLQTENSGVLIASVRVNELSLQRLQGQARLGLWSRNAERFTILAQFLKVRTFES